MRRPTALALTACSVVLRAHPAAAMAPEPVHFSYEAVAGCPSEDEFLEAVTEDGGMLERAAAAASVRSIMVAVGPGAGRLVIRDLDGTLATRVLEGGQCEDLVRSLAILVALALEPRPEVPREPPARAPAHEQDPEDRARDDDPPLERWRLGLSGEGTLNGGLSPAAVLGASFLLTIAHDSPHLFAPALRLGVETTGPADPGPQGSTSLQLSRRVVRADLCPFRFSLRQPWSSNAISADACARVDVGSLKIVGAQPPAPPLTRFTWASAGAVLRVHWDISRLFLDLDVGALAPLVRERFFQEPDVIVYEIPRLSGAGGIGVGVWIL